MAIESTEKSNEFNCGAKQHTLRKDWLISADCSSQDHDKALTSCYSSNCETIENQINDYSVTISEKGKADKKTVNHRRKRDREPSRIHVKIILKRLKKESLVKDYSLL